MNKLIILNYQREIPPFMINEIDISCNIFDQVIYITPTLSNDNSVEITKENFTLYQEASIKTPRAALKIVANLFSTEIIGDIMKAIKENRFNKGFLYHLITEIFCSEILYKGATRILQNSPEDKCTVLAAWFNVEAYAASLLKKKYSNIRAFSFAHAFEINPDRNDYVDLSLNSFKHDNLDGIFFISEKMLSIYEKFTNKIFSNQDNISVRYLGCPKLFEGLNKTNHKNFHICSCSSVVNLKRIDIILEALNEWSSCDIRYTHIGEGPLLQSMKQRAKHITDTNPLVKIEFIGKLSNNEVQRFYTENSIDLFINTSDSEGLPVSIMEAMAYGIPVIATDVGGTSEIVKKCSGILIEKGISGTKLKNYIQMYLNMSLLEKEDMRNAAHSIWKEKFNLTKNANEFYWDLINE